MEDSQIEIKDLAAAYNEAFSGLLLALAHETDFLLLTSQEVAQEAPQQASKTVSILNTSHTDVILAFNAAKPIGYCALSGGRYQRNSHVASMVIAVLQDYWGKGVANVLMNTLKARAQDRSITRLELNVREDNGRAIAFYKRHGFVKEGIRRAALKIKDKYVDEFYMAAYL